MPFISPSASSAKGLLFPLSRQTGSMTMQQALHRIRKIFRLENVFRREGWSFFSGRKKRRDPAEGGAAQPSHTGQLSHSRLPHGETQSLRDEFKQFVHFEPDEDGLYPEIFTTADEEVEMDAPERKMHEGFMKEALAQAEYALNHDETPVGCVFVHQGKIIGRGMNDTNRSLNGTRHAEFVAIATIIEQYGIDVLKQSDLYVTVEPCIMCASALRQYGIRRVFFGCANDRFGGTGGVLSIHRDRSIDPPYPAIGGIFREDAIMLLRRFYIQENAKAPVPHKKNRVLKEDIPPMQAPKSSFADTPPLKEMDFRVKDENVPPPRPAASSLSSLASSSIKSVGKLVVLPRKIIPAVPVLRPRPKVGATLRAG